MKLIEETPDRLVIELRPTGLVILCIGMFVLFFILGFGMNSFLPALVEYSGLSGAQTLDDLPQMPGMTILGLASFLPLVVAVLFLKTRRLEFDRPAGQVTIRSLGTFGRTSVTHPLANVLGAVQITNRAQDGRVAHRAALKLSGAKGLVPLTPYFTAGGGPELTVNTVNGWLVDIRGVSAEAGPPAEIRSRPGIPDPR
jgi:hypothetical protein